MSYSIDINKNITNMQIKFTIDNDAPEDFIKLWEELKNKCEGRIKTDCKKQIIDSWLKYCKIETNKNLPLLNRCELGIGGNDNIKNKQIRFRNRCKKLDNDIIIDQIYNTDYEKWNFEELHDLINAFKVFAEDYINSKGGINELIKFKINSEFKSNNLPDDQDLKYKLKNELNNGSYSDNKIKKTSYVLEVCKFNDNDNEHMGYMKAIFKSKKDASSYYDRHNPHMRKLNAHGTLKSDWDPKTNLFYIVRENYLLIDNILPFSKDDLPINNTYKYLK